MLKTLLVFLIGALVGANVLYYVAVRDRPARSGDVVTVTPTASGDGTTAKPAPPSDGHQPVAKAPAPSTTVPSSPPERSLSVPAIPGGLIVPVAGILPAQLSDTFTDARGTERVHDAIDIMAAEGTPVLAVADGIVEKLFDSKQGGLTLYQFEPTGKYAYYYAHLQRYAPGVTEKKAVRQGEVIGYVGHTGNANPEGPHLHFAVLVLGPDRKWWDGTAINPYPLLGGL